MFVPNDLVRIIAHFSHTTHEEGLAIIKNSPKNLVWFRVSKTFDWPHTIVYHNYQSSKRKRFSVCQNHLTKSRTNSLGSCENQPWFSARLQHESDIPHHRDMHTDCTISSVRSTRMAAATPSMNSSLFLKNPRRRLQRILRLDRP